MGTPKYKGMLQALTQFRDQAAQAIVPQLGPHRKVTSAPTPDTAETTAEPEEDRCGVPPRQTQRGDAGASPSPNFQFQPVTKPDEKTRKKHGSGESKSKRMSKLKKEANEKAYGMGGDAPKLSDITLLLQHPLSYGLCAPVFDKISIVTASDDLPRYNCVRHQHKQRLPRCIGQGDSGRVS
ncbi:hypothetical protein PC111_g15615 [Phytophthora cactorum]|nr:hypothetical protein PC111_g15615 [Phytophthora cactorum]KAG2884545.1 hypothetical protein PC114_g20039 [Phytophthora cactorum]